MKTGDYALINNAVVLITKIDGSKAEFINVSKTEDFDFGRKNISDLEAIEKSSAGYNMAIHVLKLKNKFKFDMWWKYRQ